LSGTLTSVRDCTGPSVDVPVVSPAGFLSIVTSSCVTGTSTVFFSVTGSLVIVASRVDSLFCTFNLSSITGILVFTSGGASEVLYLEYSSDTGGESLTKEFLSQDVCVSDFLDFA
jgi:hypothetical protein